MKNIYLLTILSLFLSLCICQSDESENKKKGIKTESVLEYGYQNKFGEILLDRQEIKYS